MTPLTLEATAIAKAYGAVQALRGASLEIRTGEIHALLGANGAGKSTLVKILTGAIRPDAGRIVVNGAERQAHSPREARRSGVLTVYQEPSLVPDLDIASNLRLTGTPMAEFRGWMAELGVPPPAASATARELPLATLRVIDLARVLAAEPRIMLLDEMTAALPADISERVLDVLRRQRDAGRSIVFISHRLVEVASLCDRATVLRDGRTVGVLDVVAGAEEHIVELMLGTPGGDEEVGVRPVAVREAQGDRPVRLDIRDVTIGDAVQGVSFAVHAGEVLGLVALEGQGQEELFEVLSGSRRPDSGELLVDGQPRRFGHPADAIAAGLVYVPANRAEALLMQRSVRENIALPTSAGWRHWGPIDMAGEARRIRLAIDRLQIDTRAQGEVRRLSGGNQQKVTIARWVAGGVHTLLCFDPTRGIDVGTKHQIYLLLRELAQGGAAVLLYTSELEEVQLVCERAVVLFGGRIVDGIDAAQADEAMLMRAAHGLTRPIQVEASPPMVHR